MTDDLITPVVQQEIENFDKTIAELVPLTVIKGENEPYLFQGDYNDYDPSCDLPFDPASSMPEQDKYPDEDSYDQYLTAQVLLPRGDAYKKGTVIWRKRDNDRNLIGHSNSNPILDTRIFEVQLPNGHIAGYTTNTIAENLYAMVDDEGYETSIFKRIVDHQCDNTKA